MYHTCRVKTCVKSEFFSHWLQLFMPTCFVIVTDTPKLKRLSSTEIAKSTKKCGNSLIYINPDTTINQVQGKGRFEFFFGLNSLPLYKNYRM